MSMCIYSHEDGAYCDKHDHGAVTVGCSGEEDCPDKRVLTNYDRLISKTPEELATILYEQGGFAPNCDHYDVCYASCRECWLSWLKQEADK